ncbi:hypothetical protein ACHAWF_004202 [Thalassiosira exigua]
MTRPPGARAGSNAAESGGEGRTSPWRIAAVVASDSARPPGPRSPRLSSWRCSRRSSACTSWRRDPSLRSRTRGAAAGRGWEERQEPAPRPPPPPPRSSRTPSLGAGAWTAPRTERAEASGRARPTPVDTGEKLASTRDPRPSAWSCRTASPTSRGSPNSPRGTTLPTST